MRAVMVEVSRNPALNDVMQHQFLDQRKALFKHVLGRPSIAAKSTPPPSLRTSGTLCPATSSSGPSFRRGLPAAARSNRLLTTW